MLDCEKLVTRPAEQPGQDAAPTRMSRRLRAPQHDRRDGDHHEREEAAVDVRVEEQRVDPEVVVVLVRRDHLRVQEQRLAVVLDEADPREHDRQRDRDGRGSAAAARGVQRTWRSSTNSSAEGDVEEGDVLGRLGVVGGVDRLQRVQRDAREQQPFRRRAARATHAQAGGRRRRPGAAPAPRADVPARARAAQQPRQQQRERAGRDDEVERDQQVDGPPAGRRSARGRAARGSPAAGTASGRRRISTASTATITTSRARSAGASAARARQGASRATRRGARSSAAHQREAPRREHFAALVAQGHAHAVFAGRRERARSSAGTRLAMAGGARQPFVARAQCRGGRSSAARTVCSARPGSRARASRRRCPRESMIATVTRVGAGRA